MAPSKHFGSALLAIGCLIQGYAQDVLGIENPARLGIPKLSISTTAVSFSDYLSLHGLFNNWQGGIAPNRGSQIGWARWGGEVDWFQLPWALRVWDLSMVSETSNKEGATFIWMTKHHLDLPVGAQFQVDLKINGLRRTGATLEHTWTMWKQGGNSLVLGTGLSGWTATASQIGTARGVAQVTSAKNYTFDLTVDYSYSKNYLYDLQVLAPRGWGFGGNLGILWTSDNWRAEAAVVDVGNRTYWPKLPMTLATAKANRSHVDLNGYTVFDPTIEGYQGTQSQVQREPVRWSGILSRDWDAYELAVQMERMANLDFLSVEGSRRTADGSRVSLGYEERTRTWRVGYQGKTLFGSLGGSSFSTQRTQSLNFQAGIRIPIQAK